MQKQNKHLEIIGELALLVHDTVEKGAVLRQDLHKKSNANQVEHGRSPICPSVQTKLTVTLLREMQQLLR